MTGLSDKIFTSDGYTEGLEIVETRDVRDTIQKLKEELRKGSSATPTAYDIIDKLFGEKLI